MKHTMKKILSLILVAIMLVTAMLVAMAEGTTYEVGDIIEFGSYPQKKVKDEAVISELNSLIKDSNGDVEYKSDLYRNKNDVWYKFEPIKWIIVKNEKQEIILFAKNVIDSKPFHPEIRGAQWLKSFLYGWLNTTFKEQAFGTISDLESIYNISVSVPSKEFLSSAENGFESNADRKTVATDFAASDYAYYYWTCDPWWAYIGYAYVVGTDNGTFTKTFFQDQTNGVRPILKFSPVNQVDPDEKNIYNLGEETYSFDNYSDSKSGGHCFGMSITSSGYYLGNLDITDVGGNNKDGVYLLSSTTKVKKKICDYQRIQGYKRDLSMVAGGTNYKKSKNFNIENDWKEVIDYVKNHKYDNSGILQIGYKGKYTNKEGKLVSGGHAINFIRYEEVNGQPRIYAYDNNFPSTETYFYQNEYGEVLQAPYSTFSGPIDCIALRNVSTYFKIIKSIDVFTAINKPLIFYAFDNSISIDGAYESMLDGITENGIEYMYEISEGETVVKIIPLIDNAIFTYMDKEYSFGKIDEDTFAEFTLATSEDDEPEFEIVNAPEDEPETPDIPDEPCTCKCHGNFIQRLIFKITNFFQKLFGKNKVCLCGVKH